MQEWVIETLNEFGYLGIALLIALENVFPPIPSEVILTFGGFMTGNTSLVPVGVILFATIGSLIGAAVLYSIGRFLSPEKMAKLLDSKFCRALGFQAKDVWSAGHWFEKHGKPAVFFGRCIPIVRSLISIPAGMTKMQFPLFLLLTTLGSVIWNTALVLLGVFAGSSWERIVGYFGIYSAITLAVLGIAFVLLLVWYLRRRHKKSENNSNS